MTQFEGGIRILMRTWSADSHEHLGRFPGDCTLGLQYLGHGDGFVDRAKVASFGKKLTSVDNLVGKMRSMLQG